MCNELYNLIHLPFLLKTYIVSIVKNRQSCYFQCIGRCQSWKPTIWRYLHSQLNKVELIEWQYLKSECRDIDIGSWVDIFNYTWRSTNSANEHNTGSDFTLPNWTASCSRRHFILHCKLSQYTYEIFMKHRNIKEYYKRDTVNMISWIRIQNWL